MYGGGLSQKSINRISRAVRAYEHAPANGRQNVRADVVDTRSEHIACVVQSVQYNYLVCRTWDATASTVGTADFNVALPDELRKDKLSPNTTGDGKTYTFTSPTAVTVSQTGQTTENWVIQPAYRLPSGNYKGSVITARMVRGGTGLTVSDKVVVYEDANTAGRGWAKV